LAHDATPAGHLVCVVRGGEVGVWRSSETPLGTWTVIEASVTAGPGAELCAPTDMHAALLHGDTVTIIPLA
jgi:hypothetical protein